MKRLLSIILALVLCSEVAFADRSEDVIARIVPQPKQVETSKGNFNFRGAAFRCEQTLDAASIDLLKRFSARVSLVSGKSCPFSSTGGLSDAVSNGSAKGVIFLKDDNTPDGSYRIEATTRMCVVRAAGFDGLKNAISTLMQLLPESVYTTGNGSADKWTIPACTITDTPGSPQRALTVDCAKAFRDIKELKGVVDLAVRYKFNTIRMVLSSEDRWRFKGEKSSAFAQVSIFYDSGNEKSIYTPSDVSELRKYAERNGVMLIPELVRPSKILQYIEFSDIPDISIEEIAQTFGYEPSLIPAEAVSEDISDVDIKNLAEKVWK